MPRVDIVDDLNDTLKSDVTEFFRGREGDAGPSALATPSPASGAAAATRVALPTQKRADAKTDAMTPLMLVAVVATIATFAALLYVTMSSSFAGPALAANADGVADEVEEGAQEEEEEEEEEDAKPPAEHWRA